MVPEFRGGPIGPWPRDLALLIFEPLIISDGPSMFCCGWSVLIGTRAGDWFNSGEVLRESRLRSYDCALFSHLSRLDVGARAWDTFLARKIHCWLGTWPDDDGGFGFLNVYHFTVRTWSWDCFLRLIRWLASHGILWFTINYVLHLPMVASNPMWNQSWARNSLAQVHSSMCPPLFLKFQIYYSSCPFRYSWVYMYLVQEFSDFL